MANNPIIMGVPEVHLWFSSVDTNRLKANARKIYDVLWGHNTPIVVTRFRKIAGVLFPCSAKFPAAHAYVLLSGGLVPMNDFLRHLNETLRVAAGKSVPIQPQAWYADGDKDKLVLFVSHEDAKAILNTDKDLHWDASTYAHMRFTDTRRDRH